MCRQNWGDLDSETTPKVNVKARAKAKAQVDVSDRRSCQGGFETASVIEPSLAPGLPKPNDLHLDILDQVHPHPRLSTGLDECGLNV